MPTYAYHCQANGQTVEAVHGIDVELRYWVELCYVAQHPPGETDPMAPVRRVIAHAPAISVTTSNAELRNLGMTKLVKRDQGVYENVTALDGEARYMRAGDPHTVPHLHRKVGD